MMKYVIVKSFVVQSFSCPTLCDPVDCSMPQFPDLHYLLEFAQTHVHQIGDTIQASHLLLLVFWNALYFWTLFSSNQWTFLLITSSVQSPSSVQLFVTPWTAAHQASLSITNSQSLPKLMSIESVISSNPLIFCHPLLLLPSIFPSIRVFSNESVLRISWPKYWSFSFSISPSNKYSGLISLRMDWLDLLAVQRTLKSLLQHHSSKASILQCSAFFIF